MYHACPPPLSRAILSRSNTAVAKVVAVLLGSKGFETIGCARLAQEPTPLTPFSQDGSAALGPAVIKLPDDWVWASEWKIDGSGGRDGDGWEYGKDLIKFNTSRGEFICLFTILCAYIEPSDASHDCNIIG